MQAELSKRILNGPNDLSGVARHRAVLPADLDVTALERGSADVDHCGQVRLELGNISLYDGHQVWVNPDINPGLGTDLGQQTAEQRPGFYSAVLTREMGKQAGDYRQDRANSRLRDGACELLCFVPTA